MSQNAEMSQNIGDLLSSMNFEKAQLSTLAKKGDEDLVQNFMTENVSVSGDGTETSQSQLYMASFWGIFDAVKVCQPCNQMSIYRVYSIHVLSYARGFDPFTSGTF